MPDTVAKALEHIAKMIQQAELHCHKCKGSKPLPELLQELQANIITGLDKRLEVMEQTINHPPPAQERLEGVSEKIEQAAENIKAAVGEISNSIAKVSDTNTQLAKTATSYKDVLISGKVKT